MGMGGPGSQALSDLIEKLKESGDYRPSGKPMDKSPSGLPWMAVWHLNSFERGYWLTPDPLEVTQQNLIRGKAIYLKRCSGCHGQNGDGKGPAADALMVKPFDFSADSVSSNPGASSGMMYHRILTAGPGTAMENFGTRLSVEDIWRVVLFLRTIHKGGLSEPLPTVEMFEKWNPPQPLLNYVETHPVQAKLPVPEPGSEDAFMKAAHWISPGMAADDVILVGGQIPMNLDRLSALVKETYFNMVSTAYEDAKGRGEQLPEREKLMSVAGITFHAP